MSLGLALSLTPGSAEAAGKKAQRTAMVETSDGAYRAHEGKVDLFLPERFQTIDGKYDVIVHFHGMAKLQEANAKQANVNAAVVSVNLGAVADKYGKAFRDPRAFDRLLAKTHRMVMASRRIPRTAAMGRIALSAWSAGFASVGEILKQDNRRATSRIDAVLIADGLHAAYADKTKHTIEESSLSKYVKLAHEAGRGDKLFVLTHSSIPTYGYATVHEAVGAVLRLASFEKEAPPTSTPRNMVATYQVNRGDLHITGFEGRGVPDHIDHIRAMGESMYPMLAARWAPTQPTGAPLIASR